MYVKRILVICVLLVQSAYASRHNIDMQLGMGSGEFVFGADYEYKIKDYVGVGGAFFFANKDDDRAIPQILSFDTLAKFHLLQAKELDLYIGAGIGFHALDVEIEALKIDKDDSFLGPCFKGAFLYQFTPLFAAGLSYIRIMNWTSDDFGPFSNHFEYAMLDFRLSFK